VGGVRVEGSEVKDPHAAYVVAWDGIEPPTRGFSVLPGDKIEEDEKGRSVTIGYHISRLRGLITTPL
jgi:hypothetical protein